MRETKWWRLGIRLSILIPTWIVLFVLSFLFFIPMFFHVEEYTGKGLIGVLIYVLLRLLWALALSFVLALIISSLVVFVISKAIWRARR